MPATSFIAASTTGVAKDRLTQDGWQLRQSLDMLNEGLPRLRGPPGQIGFRVRGLSLL